jgi:hypothetical protein
MMMQGLILHCASNPFSTRGGSVGCPANVLPHVTPSPRVPAAGVSRHDPPHLALLHGGPHNGGSGPGQNMVNVLPHVTPSQEYLQTIARRSAPPLLSNEPDATPALLQPPVWGTVRTWWTRCTR